MGRFSSLFPHGYACAEGERHQQRRQHSRTKIRTKAAEDQAAEATAAEADQAPSVSDLPVPVRVREEEGILYMDLLVGKDGGPS